MAKYLIVTADDFGAARGVNLGIVHAHVYGVVTATSLMVTMPFAEEARALAAETPSLDVGLHVDLSGECPGWDADLDDPADCSAAIRRQLLRFEALTGRAPTHLDTHYNLHRDPRVAPRIREVAHERGLPLREHSVVRYFSHFYGQWDGETHLEHIAVDNLITMLDTEVHEGVTEFGCHPGFPDGAFQSPYLVERPAELETLCDPAVARALRDRNIQLIGFRQLAGAVSRAHG